MLWFADIANTCWLRQILQLIRLYLNRLFTFEIFIKRATAMIFQTLLHQKSILAWLLTQQMLSHLINRRVTHQINKYGNKFLKINSSIIIHIKFINDFSKFFDIHFHPTRFQHCVQFIQIYCAITWCIELVEQLAELLKSTLWNLFLGFLLALFVIALSQSALAGSIKVIGFINKWLVLRCLNTGKHLRMTVISELSQLERRNRSFILIWAIFFPNHRFLRRLLANWIHILQLLWIFHNSYFKFKKFKIWIKKE